MSESNLEDRAAIHDLFTRYCCALDNGEIEAVVDCFRFHLPADTAGAAADTRGRRSGSFRRSHHQQTIIFLVCRPVN